MKIKVLEVKEVAGLLRVKVDTDYGVEDIGISLDKKKSDPITGQPLWYSEVKELLLKKYKDAKPPITGTNLIGKELEI